MEEKLNNAMVLFGQYRRGRERLLDEALSEVEAYLVCNPDNQKANELKRNIKAALQNAR